MHEGLERLLEAEVRGAGFKLYHWLLLPGARKRILRVFVHGEAVNLDDCAAVSRRLGAAIEAAEALEGSYLLEVSTPGTDRALFEPWHYEIALGQRVTLLVRVGSDEDVRERRDGLIAAVDADELVLDTEQGTERIEFAMIVKAKLIPEYDMRGAKRRDPTEEAG